MCDWQTAAATNNAEWCDIVCRTHGLLPALAADAWTSATRTPVYYPDAVTLVAGVAVPELLPRVDPSAGCSVKDSFADLDLSEHAFRVLFDAQWIVGVAPSPAVTPVARWERVRDRDTFEAWERAWRGPDGPAGVLRAELLDHDAVAILAAREGDRVVAGAVLNRSATVVGISNFFADAPAAAEHWSGCVDCAGSIFPGSTFVGYAFGDELAVAREHGFEIVGPLRVWIND